MSLKNKLISLIVITFITISLLCILFTGNSVPLNTYLSNGSAANTEGTVNYTNKGPATNKMMKNLREEEIIPTRI